jgi:hypothetical protein
MGEWTGARNSTIARTFISIYKGEAFMAHISLVHLDLVAEAAAIPVVEAIAAAALRAELELRRATLGDRMRVILKYCQATRCDYDCHSRYHHYVSNAPLVGENS